MPELSGVVNNLLNDPSVFDSDPNIFCLFERFMIVCYSKVSSATTLDEARLKLFETGTKVLETLPPTTAAYYQHCRRTILQGAFLWRQCFIAMMDVPLNSGWEWAWDGTKWVPLWTTKKVASAVCEFLKKCG